MNGVTRLCLAATMGLSIPLHAFGWGTVTGPHGGTATTGPRGAGYAQGPNGGTAYRGPMGAGYARGPNGGTAYRGPMGAGAAYGPNGATAYRGPYGGAVATGPNGGTAYRAPYPAPYPGRAVYAPGAVYGGAVVRPWVAAPYYGAVVAGVTLGTLIAATAVPPPPAPQLCWYWSSPVHTQGYWDYCSG